jgi:16S rRNA (guanine527-N7)-methyltransferase
VRAALDRLAEQHGLSPRFAAQMEVVLGLLVAEEASVSSVRQPEAAVATHVADALDGLAADALRTAGVVADLGAGAGFPGLALAAARPEARFVLVESVGRKCAFMDRAAAAAGLDNVEVVNGRAEAWAEGLGRCEVVTARALAPLPVLVEYAAPLLALGGSLVAWKGRRDPDEEADGLAAAAVTGLRASEVLRMPGRPGAEHRHLHVYLKASPTPDRFPRRPGMARKRPITATTPR